MDIDLEKFKQTATGKANENRKFLKGLARVSDNKLDKLFHETHEEVFSEVDCLACANCCKTTSPIFYQSDIERLAKALRMKPGDFISKYLHVDEDRDYVLNSAPCPFLGPDNFCSVYDSRPKACREYPHTDRKKMSQVLDLTYRNSKVCPAVLEILERIKSLMKP
jgi:Fe-S-cluster containining protein